MTALEGKKSSTNGSDVWRVLVSDRGMTEDKFKDWKRKSLSFIGRGSFYNKDWEVAIPNLEAAAALFAGDSTKSKELAQHQDFATKAKKKLQEYTKKEQSRWSEAFKKNAVVAEAEEKAAEEAKAAAATSSSSNGKRAKADVKGVKGIADKVISDSLGDDSKDNSTLAKPYESLFPWLFGLGLMGAVGGLAFYFLRARRFR